jgi:Flp pilus assembly protein TadD
MSRVVRVDVRGFRLLAGLGIASAAVWSTTALAQGAPVVSQPVVQSLPNPAVQNLNAALAKLGRDPRNVEALIDAGDAARNLGDFDAATGFYRRAEDISPDNARVKAGIARALVMNGDPVGAISYFDAAERAGASSAEIAGDRALAYDLVGDNARAQQYYAVAMVSDASDEVRMRFALSQAISGDRPAAEATLMPLLRKQDKPGWRTRAFALAIDGETKQAVEITESMLPPELAQNVVPYLRYMPRLTKAQQAAAANLGRFPRASEIGRDDPSIAAYKPTRVAVADAGLAAKSGVPAGDRKAKASNAVKPSSTLTRSERQKAEKERRAEAARKVALAARSPDRVAPPEPKPAIESTGELPPLRKDPTPSPVVAKPAAIPRPAPAPAPMPAPVRQPAVAAAPAPSAGNAAPVKASESGGPAAAPGFDLAHLPASQPPKASAPAAPPAPSMAEAFADLGKPVTKAVPTSGAVDIRQIEPAKPKPKPKPEPKKPAPPAHPSRIWVQIGVGRNKSAIAFDWRRYTKKAPELFKGREANITDLGRTNRILAGPFETRKAANAFVADLKKAGIDGAMPWISPAGQVVDVLPVK